MGCASSTPASSTPAAGTCLQTLQGHTSWVLGVACFALADGSPRAVSASHDKTLRV